MKRYINCLLSAALLMVIAVGCKKEENRVIFNGGTPPVLTANVAANKVLTAPNKNNQFISMSWTNPDYMFNTGVSSHTVNYIIQIDTVGANFTNPDKQEVSISADKEKKFTVGEFNGLLTRMKLLADIPHNLEMRVVSNINGTLKLESNVIRITGVVPYEDFAIAPPTTNELFMTGDATGAGWTNTPPVAQKAVRVDRGEYYFITQLTPGKFYKFLSHQGNWQPQYGGNNAMGGDLGVNMGGGNDPDAIPTPADAGTYKITVNFRTGKYTVVKQ